MASLSKLSIRGIRSFSPDKDETIEFYSPLTMIVGANGCGKTSIIECLKCACTGLLPPNTRSGRSFINDPSLTDATEVKANIKLRFMDKQSKPTVLVRSFQLTKKKNKLEYKALEGVVRRTNDNGDKVSLSEKCSELDKHIPELLGVSAPIMENVIFCHQEENTWPLQEGASLKKKFDDIFESTRYSKALDAILKAKKDFSQRAKELKVEVAELGAHLQGATEMRDRLDSCNDRQGLCEQELEDTGNALAAVDVKITRNQELMRQYSSAQKELTEKQWRLSQFEERVRERVEALDQELLGTDDELAKLVKEFDGDMATRRNELLAMQRTIDNLNAEIAALRARNDTLQSQRGEALSVKSQFDSQQAGLRTQIEKLSKKHKLSAALVAASTSTASNSIVPSSREFLRQLDSRMKESQRSSEESVSRARESASGREKEYMDSHVAQQRLVIEIEAKEAELNKLTKEQDTLRVNLSQGLSGRRMVKSARDEAQQAFDDATRQSEEFQRVYNEKSNALKTQLKDLNDRLRDLTDAINLDDSLLLEANSFRAEIDKLVVAEKQARADEDLCEQEAQGLFLKYQNVMSRPSGSAATTSDLHRLKESLTVDIRDLEKSLDRARQDVRNTGNDRSRIDADLAQNDKRCKELEGKLRSLRREEEGLQDCLRELNDLRATAYKKPLDPVTLDGGCAMFVELCKEEARSLTEHLFVAQSAEMWVKRVTSYATKPKSVPPGSAAICPCCERGMNTQEKEVFERVVVNLFKTPSAEQTAKANGFKLRGDELVERVSAISIKFLPAEEHKREIAELKIQIKDLSEAREELQRKEVELDKLITTSEKRLSEIKACVVEINSLYQRWEDLSLRRQNYSDRRIRQSQSMSMPDLGGRSFVDVETTQRERKIEKEELSKKKEQMVASESLLTKQLFQLKQNVSDRERDLNEVKNKESQQLNMERRLTEIDSQKNTVQEEKLKLSQRLGAAERELRDRQVQLDTAKLTLRQAEEAASESYLSLQSDRDSLRTALDQLEAQEKRMGAVNLADIDRDLNLTKRDMEAKETVIRDFTPKMQALNASMSSQEQFKKNVLDNIYLRQIRKEMEVLRGEIGAMEGKIGSSTRDYKDIQRELQRSEQEKQKLGTQQATLKGRLEELHDQQKSLQSQLNSQIYRNIDQRYRKKNIEYETTMMAVSDLEAYFKALDAALMSFHTIKIREVNKIVKELWQAIYRGADIDTIEIVSGEDGDGSGVSAKRSYNYRVEMRKGDTPLEMRGRCSAGQCMLAGIVIRLALAESFCITCGILALDEPTTNLDEANKMGLAQALARLISNRSHQQNFQLLCITHDEDFVQMMRTELSSLSSFSLPEYYFRISRQEEGGSGRYFSRIERIPWEDM